MHQRLLHLKGGPSMPYRFIDFLIGMTDPQNLARFKENPDAAMNAAGLSAVEKAAVMSGKSGWIRLLGKREIEKDNGTESLQDGLSANEHIGQSDIERDDVPQQLDVTQELDVTSRPS
jgi:hypothetical protein